MDKVEKSSAQSKRAALKSKELTDSEDLSDLQFVHQDKDTAREAKKLTQERSHGRRSDDDGAGRRRRRKNSTTCTVGSDKDTAATGHDYQLWSNFCTTLPPANGGFGLILP